MASPIWSQGQQAAWAVSGVPPIAVALHKRHRNDRIGLSSFLLRFWVFRWPKADSVGTPQFRCERADCAAPSVK
jgi:hypothetical protein